MDFFDTLFVITGVFTGVAILVYLGYFVYSIEKATHLWNEICEGAELEIQREPWFGADLSAKGRIHGFMIYVSVFQTTERKAVIVETELPVTVPEQLQVTRRGFFGSGSPPSGHAKFDEYVAVKGEPPGLFVAKLSQPEIRDTLLEVMAKYPNYFSVKERRLSIRVQYSLKRKEEAFEIFEDLIRLAKAFDETFDFTPLQKEEIRNAEANRRAADEEMRAEKKREKSGGFSEPIW